MVNFSVIKASRPHKEKRSSPRYVSFKFQQIFEAHLLKLMATFEAIIWSSTISCVEAIEWKFTCVDVPDP